MSSKLKHQLYNYCVTYVEQRIKNITDTMNDSQASANAETKSTAGDKHDTARAMMHLAAEQNAKLLAEANKLKQVIHLIDPNKSFQTPELGSYVVATNGNFYISISAGRVEIDNKNYFLVSPVSPIALAMKNKKAGDQFDLNGRTFEIKSII